jgi:hypothetical protein
MIDLVLIFMYIAVAGAIGSVVWAVVHRWQLHDQSARVTNGIPARKIVLATAGLLAGCLLLTFLLGSSAPIMVNGKPYGEVFWLKTADMFINTAIVLLLVAVIAVVCSNVRNARSRR